MNSTFVSKMPMTFSPTDTGYIFSAGIVVTRRYDDDDARFANEEAIPWNTTNGVSMNVWQVQMIYLSASRVTNRCNDVSVYPHDTVNDLL